eukprot:TRINITY_DN1639_c0_g2_i1.p1 TRINITY_DN1639_c0_g2~~TRINITY_DN1639_c0_g2_i1.p1  ORF type:complete len:627 (-),score=145.13 TRINITY_DN1639_c0_g2_i1:215-2095(-)
MADDDVIVGTKEELLSQLEQGIKSGNLALVKKLVKSSSLVNEKFKILPHQTPLHLACAEGNFEIIKALIEAGADINTKDNGGWSSLHYTAICSSVSISQILRNFDFILQRRDVDVTSKTEEETSVLHYLVRYVRPTEPMDVGYYINILNQMISKGSEMNAANQYGETPLHYGSLRGNKEATIFLLRNRALVNIPNCAQETPLHYAARNGRTDIARLLMLYGADVNAKSVDGTPYDLAALRPETQKAIKDQIEKYGQFLSVMESTDGHNIKILRRVTEAFFRYFDESDLVPLEDKIELFSNIVDVIRANEVLMKEIDSSSVITESLVTNLIPYVGIWTKYLQKLLPSLNALQRSKKNPRFYDALTKKETAEKTSLRMLLQAPAYRFTTSPQFLQELLDVAEGVPSRIDSMENACQSFRESLTTYNEQIASFNETAVREEDNLAQLAQIAAKEGTGRDTDMDGDKSNKVVTFTLPPLKFLSVNGWDSWWKENTDRRREKKDSSKDLGKDRKDSNKDLNKELRKDSSKDVNKDFGRERKDSSKDVNKDLGRERKEVNKERKDSKKLDKRRNGADGGGDLSRSTSENKVGENDAATTPATTDNSKDHMDTEKKDPQLMGVAETPTTSTSI